MNKQILFHSILVLFLVFSCNPVTTESKETHEPQIYWHWEDNFTAAEKTKIKKYITEVTDAAFQVLGRYPFGVHYYFNRSNSKNEPIPWAHTERSRKIQGVRFYINPDFDYEIMFADWTAPHEISHLSLPSLGRMNSWFSEGYASYMQYQIMQEMGIYTKEEVAEKYKNKFEYIKGDYSDTLNFVENAKLLRSRYNFPAMYWGGAMYFVHINDLLLSQEETNLNTVMQKYQSCCRNKNQSIEMLLHSLDKDLKTPLFSNLYKKYNTKPFSEIYKEE